MSVTLEQFGGGPAVDNTPAVDSYNDYCVANGPTVLELGPHDYRCDSQPKTFDQVAPIIQGIRAYGTRLVFNFLGTRLQGGIHVSGCKGASFRRMSFRNIYPGAQASLLSIKSTVDVDASHFVIEDVFMDADLPTNQPPYSLVVDGSLKTSGPPGAPGVRTSNIRNLTIYVGSDGAALFKETSALTWTGGWVYGSINIQSNSTVNPCAIQIQVNEIAGHLYLAGVWDGSIRAQTISGNIYTDSNTLNTWVHGRLVGTIDNGAPNWVNSGLIAA